MDGREGGEARGPEPTVSFGRVGVPRASTPLWSWLCVPLLPPGRLPGPAVALPRAFGDRGLAGRAIAPAQFQRHEPLALLGPPHDAAGRRFWLADRVRSHSR